MKFTSWRVTRMPGGFRVDDAVGRPLGYFYCRNTADETRRLTRDEVLLMAETALANPPSGSKLTTVAARGQGSYDRHMTSGEKRPPPSVLALHPMRDHRR
jgi:hypothetical protein